MDLTVFITHVGLFRFKCMSFGLSSAPSCFQKIMSLILAGIQGVSIYLEDVVVHAPSTSFHGTRLKQFFQRLEQQEVTLKSEYRFGVEESLSFRLLKEDITPIMSPPPRHWPSMSHHRTAAHVPTHADPFQPDRANHRHLQCLRDGAGCCALPDSRGGGTPGGLRLACTYSS